MNILQSDVKYLKSAFMVRLINSSNFICSFCLIRGKLLPSYLADIQYILSVLRRWSCIISKLFISLSPDA